MINDTHATGLFITGTDTDVGKTFIGAQIVSALIAQGKAVAPRKPIESGCVKEGNQLIPQDAFKYHLATKKLAPLDEICPYRFEPAISPQRAARLVNKPLATCEVVEACFNNTHGKELIIVEGAGGFYSPLCEDGLNADLAENLNLPVLLVAKDQLGCINHILLTQEAIHKRGLELRVLILNQIDKTHDASMNNFEDLKSQLGVHIFVISHGESITSNSSKSKQLLDALFV